MPTPTPAEFWSLLVRTRLVEEPVVARLRVEVAALPGVADTRSIADWLVDRGLITAWQRKRLVIGDEGPFFFGDYRLLERRPSAGRALVFTARHERSGTLVSLVRLDPQAWRDAATRDGILRRAKAAVAVVDPAVVRTWALEESGSTRFLVAEMVRGETLAAELVRRGRLPLAEAGAVALEVARAVAAVQATGDAHGGVSLDAAVREPAAGGADGVGRVRLLQFPLTGDPHVVPARPAIASAEEIEALGRNAGFLAPELLRPGTACTAASDVYAIGGLLHALVTGEAPCWQGDPASTLRRTAAEGPARLGPPHFPRELGDLLSYLMARDPAARYATAADAARAIAACFGLPCADLPVPIAPPAVPPVTRPPANSVAARPTVDALAAVPRRPPSAVRRRRFPTTALAAVAATAACLVGAAIWLAGQRADGPVAERRAKPRATPSPDPTADAAAGASDAGERSAARASAAPTPAITAMPRPPAGQDVDDPTLPWASPTDGPPPDLAYLPAGSQLFLVSRPAAALGAAASGEGRLFLEALGPVVGGRLREVASACGCEPADVDRLHVGWQTDASGELVVGWAAWLAPGKQLPDDEAWRERAWGPPRDGLYGDERAASWVPPAEAGRVLVRAPRARLSGIVEAAGTDGSGASPGLTVELDQLRSTLDATRHLTLLGQPSFLLHGGAALLAGRAAPLAAPLDALLGESVPAAALSLHFGDDFYAELDAVPARDLQPAKLAADLAARIAGYPDAVEAWCAALDVHPYARRLVSRLPGMLRIAAAHLRSGPERRQAVVNLRLPAHAGHNLALAAELALSQPTTAASAGPSVPASPPQGALARLAKPMTLEFAKDTLEKSIQMIADEVEVPMEIRGSDLQLEGITKNQSFALAERDKAAEAILRVILAKADPGGKLVYVVRTHDGVESIEITTRAAATKRGDTLPPVFRESGGTRQPGDGRDIP